MGSTDKDAVFLVITDLRTMRHDHAMHGTASGPISTCLYAPNFAKNTSALTCTVNHTS
jgi:hypothetical protein